MNHGFLGADVWAPYIGLASGPLASFEPFDDPNYQRGMIAWRTDPHGLIWGRAEIAAPKGIYTHLIFFWGPHKIHATARVNPLEQSIVFDRAGFVEIDPIVNKDYLPR